VCIHCDVNVTDYCNKLDFVQLQSKTVFIRFCQISLSAKAMRVTNVLLGAKKYHTKLKAN